MIHPQAQKKRRISYTKKGWNKITTKGITEEGEKEKYKEIKDFLVDTEKKVKMI